MATIIEFIRDTPNVIETVQGVKIRCFEVPQYKYFARGELLYLAFILNVDEHFIINKINELRLGRKTIEKLYAIRFDVEPWKHKRLTLPNILENDVDVTELEPIGNATIRVSLHFNGIKDFLRITLYEHQEFREITITRLAGYKGIVRYLIYF